MFEAQPLYDTNRRRYLHCWFNPSGVRFDFFWNSKHLGPRVALNWFADCRLNIPGKAHHIEVRVSPGFDAGCVTRVNVCKQATDDEWMYETLPDPLVLGPGEPALFTELLSLARSIAAGRAPKDAILGLIEDRFPHPWSLLATDNPLSCLEKLCRFSAAC